MKKHYSSDSHISINVVLKNGNSMHIAFVALSNGGSVYSTDNEDVQEALERHYRFGSLFNLDRTEEDEEDNPTKVVAIDEGKDNDNEATNLDESGTHKVKVSDIGEAKDYLADTFGVSRTSLRSQKVILEAAKANNIEFEGL